MPQATDYPFHRPKRVRWLNVALGCGIALSAPTVIGMTSYLRATWNDKESVSDHTADMRAVNAERASSIDSVRSQLALDSAFMQRILDAVCTDKQNVRACRP